MSLASRIPLLRDIDPFYGWWIIVACVVINHVGAGFIAYGFSVIIDPIQKELDWSTAAIALAFSLRSEVRSLGSPIAGILVDRFGARAMMAVGVLVMGIGCLVLSNVNTLLGFYLASLIISPGHSLANPTIAAVMVAKWFVRWRSRALTLLMLGTGLGGLNAPTMGLLIVRFGWRGALRVLAVLMWVVGLPLAATLKDDPQRAGVLPDGDREQPSPESAGRTARRREPHQPQRGVYLGQGAPQPGLLASAGRVHSHWSGDHAHHDPARPGAAAGGLLPASRGAGRGRNSRWSPSPDASSLAGGATS